MVGGRAKEARPWKFRKQREWKFSSSQFPLPRAFTAWVQSKPWGLLLWVCCFCFCCLWVVGLLHSLGASLFSELEFQVDNFPP